MSSNIISLYRRGSMVRGRPRRQRTATSGETSRSSLGTIRSAPVCSRAARIAIKFSTFGYQLPRFEVSGQLIAILPRTDRSSRTSSHSKRPSHTPTRGFSCSVSLECAGMESCHSYNQYSLCTTDRRVAAVAYLKQCQCYSLVLLIPHTYLRHRGKRSIAVARATASGPGNVTDSGLPSH